MRCRYESGFSALAIHSLESEDDEKSIGVYSTEDKAKGAIARLGTAPGFKDCPEAFLIDIYELGQRSMDGGLRDSLSRILGAPSIRAFFARQVGRTEGFAKIGTLHGHRLLRYPRQLRPGAPSVRAFSA